MWRQKDGPNPSPGSSRSNPDGVLFRRPDIASYSCYNVFEGFTGHGLSVEVIFLCSSFPEWLLSTKTCRLHCIPALRHNPMRPFIPFPFPLPWQYFNFLHGLCPIAENGNETCPNLTAPKTIKRGLGAGTPKRKWRRGQVIPLGPTFPVCHDGVLWAFIPFFGDVSNKNLSGC